MAGLEIHRYMTIGAWAVTCDQHVDTARNLMKAHSIRHLPVLQGGFPVGVVTDRDVAFTDRLPGVAHQLTVEQIMTPTPYTASPDTSIAEAARQMAKQRIGSTVVVSSGKVVGMFTVVDALRALADLAEC